MSLSPGFFSFAWQSRSDTQCSSKCTFAVGLLAFGISPQATDVQRFINWMKAIRSSTQVAKGTRYVIGTAEAPKRFVDSLQTKVAIGESEDVVGIEPILPHLVKKKELCERFLSESTDPARPENLYF